MTGAFTSALAQTAVAVGAHTLATGCLPSARGVGTAIPATVAAVLVLDRILRGRPLLALAGGQLSAHAALAAVVACTAQVAGHGAGTPSAVHDPGAHPHLVMTFAHLAALMLCRALLQRAVALVDQAVAVAVATVLALVRRVVRPDRPVASFVHARQRGDSPRSMTGRVCAWAVSVRGPPSGLPLSA